MQSEPGNAEPRSAMFIPSGRAAWLRVASLATAATVAAFFEPRLLGNRLAPLPGIPPEVFAAAARRVARGLAGPFVVARLQGR